MNKDAFELIGKLMQNHLIIQSIKIKKKGFKVKWTSGLKTKIYSFETWDIECFLEIYDLEEQELTK